MVGSDGVVLGEVISQSETHVNFQDGQKIWVKVKIPDWKTGSFLAQLSIVS